MPFLADLSRASVERPQKLSYPLLSGSGSFEEGHCATVRSFVLYPPTLKILGCRGGVQLESFILQQGSKIQCSKGQGLSEGIYFKWHL